MEDPIRPHKLFGGAIDLAFPDRFVDVSEFRSVPDNQEVFTDANLDQSLIIEFLERAEGVPDEAAGEFFFNDLAAAMEAVHASIASIAPMHREQVSALGVPLGTSSMYVEGEMVASKGRQGSGALNKIHVMLLVVRLKQVSTDMLITLNTPIFVHGASTVAEQVGAGYKGNHVAAPSLFQRIIATLAIKDYGLFGFANLPTPITRWHLPGLPSDVEAYIKHDDLTGMQLSGNKVRKLEFLLADALAKGHDVCVTIGGIQSNHTRATAVAARYVGLETHLLLRTSRALVEQDPGLTGNLLIERLVGARIHLVTKEEYSAKGQAALGAALVEQLRKEGRNPYLIPVGGSSPVGAWGYLTCMEEIKNQLQSEELGDKTFTDIAMACGSGGTTTGLALGCRLAGLDAMRVNAYMVCDDENYFSDHLTAAAANLGLNSTALGDVGATKNVRFVQAKGRGYAINRQEELQTIADVARTTGVILDNVYGGKAVHAMLQEIKDDPAAWSGRRILYIHTGGLFGLYDAAPALQQLLLANGGVSRFDVP